MLNPVRSIVAVLGGFLIFNVLHQLLELVIVRAAAGGPLPDMAAYMAVRDRTTLVAAQFIYDPMAALLAGYTVAKLAGAFELGHAALAAAVLAAGLVRGFGAGSPPHSLSLQILFVALCVLAVAGGAAVRAKARTLLQSDDVRVKPDTTSGSNS